MVAAAGLDCMSLPFICRLLFNLGTNLSVRIGAYSIGTPTSVVYTSIGKRRNKIIGCTNGINFEFLTI
jgi:hypothetical protein